MYGWLVGFVLRRNIRRINVGDYQAMLRNYAENAVLIFPGNSSWGGEHRGKEAIGRFLERFSRVGIQFEPHEILVRGMPWNTTLCVVFSDSARGLDGSIIYENHGVIYAQTRWGKITLQEDFEDTEKVAAFDRYLSAHPELESAPLAVVR